ncbi:MAG: hypothetical protein GEV03_16945 [Streptosporangiales bacterium]|nr:hypothetical protein [Streptosporangiales bacterium]
MAERTADLVLEGGGVKGIGLVGAVSRLAEEGYRFRRIGGTSAGAMVGAFVAALEATEQPLSRLVDIERTVDYAAFPDRGPIGRYAGPLRPLVDAGNLMLENGIYEGDYLRDWVYRSLADLGVRTFGDLRLPPDPESGLAEEHRYRLVVTAADVSQQRFLRLPWDYADYGLDPDEQRVADAVRMSASIPFFFEPTTLRGAGRSASTVVDGALFSSYPITIFDRTDGKPPRWPTFGVRLSPTPEPRVTSRPVDGVVSLAIALVESMYGAWDAMRIDDPCNMTRTIFVDTAGVSGMDFELPEEQQRELFAAGRKGVEEFLRDWDFDEYLRDCRGVRQ